MRNYEVKVNVNYGSGYKAEVVKVYRAKDERHAVHIAMNKVMEKGAKMANASYLDAVVVA